MKLATLCYVQTASHTLMVHRNKKENDMHEGKWNGLGGKIEPGESPEECVVREVLEESGLKISTPHLKGVLTFPAFDGLDDWYVFVFTADRFEGALTTDSPEGDLEWVETEKLNNLELWDGDCIFLKWLGQDRFFSGKFIYNNGHLVSHSVSFYGATGF